MRVGTPGFSGSRLREAREVRGLSVISLSELALVSPQAVYHYENDKTSPSPDVLDRIADALRLPRSFFLLPSRAEERGTIFYRSMASATKGARNRAEHRTVWLRDVAGYLSEFVSLPEGNFPALALPGDPLLLSDDEIEEAAGEVRRYWRMGDGPVANMVLLLENQGAIISRDQLGAESLDSLSEFSAKDQRPYIVLGTDKGTPVRWRFDAAHELGHIVLHGHVSPTNLARPELHKKIEGQAHRFASAFLLPLASFGEDLFAANLDAFRALKPKWKTSIGMMIIRARHAGLLSEATEKSLWISYSRRKWRRSEPYDDSMEVEEPRLLRRAFEVLLESGAQTPADVTGRLGLPSFDIETLAGLTNGYLSDYARVVLAPNWPSRPPPDGPEDPTATPARVIQMQARRRTR